MAIVTLNPTFLAISGRVGGIVYKTYRDKIVVTRVPRFDGYVPSAAQRQRRDRMREATAYAKRVYAVPAAKAIYVAAAKELGRQPFRLAVSDFLAGCPRVAFAPWARRMRIPPRRPRITARPKPRCRCCCRQEHIRTVSIRPHFSNRAIFSASLYACNRTSANFPRSSSRGHDGAYAG